MPDKEKIELYTELHRLVRQMHRMAHRGWHEHGHYREQSRLLRLIADNDGIIQRDLAEEMDVRPSSMTEMLMRMEQHGLITREQDQKDQRIIHVRLTQAGKEMADESADMTDGMADTMFRCLTEEELSKLLELTRKLNESLDAMAPMPCMEGGCHGHRHGRGPGEDRAFRNCCHWGDMFCE